MKGMDRYIISVGRIQMFTRFRRFKKIKKIGVRKKGMAQKEGKCILCLYLFMALGLGSHSGPMHTKLHLQQEKQF